MNEAFIEKAEKVIASGLIQSKPLKCPTKNDCFAFRKTQSYSSSCRILKELNCVGCKFYKTEEEFVESEKRTFIRRYGRNGLRELEEAHKNYDLYRKKFKR